MNGNTHRNNKKGGHDMFTFYCKFIVRKHERALLLRDGDFVKFLEPGVYRRFTLLHRYTVDRVDLSEPLFEHRLSDFLVENYKEDVALLRGRGNRRQDRDRVCQ